MNHPVDMFAHVHLDFKENLVMVSFCLGITKSEHIYFSPLLHCLYLLSSEVSILRFIIVDRKLETAQQ